MIRKIAITGALGHIGSKIIHSSFSDMHGLEEIRLVDNLLTQRYASLFNLPKGIRYNFYNGITNRQQEKRQDNGYHVEETPVWWEQN